MHKAVKSNGSYCMALALRIVLVLQKPRVSAPGPMHSQSQWLSHDGVVCECYRFSLTVYLVDQSPIIDHSSFMSRSPKLTSYQID